MKQQTRQAIDGGGWFDLNKAEKFEEARRWDGRNHVSVATGSPWASEALYRTAKGAYILNHWSGEQGSLETWERIGSAAAHDWLVLNGHADEVPTRALAALEA